ncbi:MAG: hypothetical protein J5666_01415 [Bacilli bacterium]|nr:hypothetical protein [Bacilli bacterium]
MKKYLLFIPLVIVLLCAVIVSIALHVDTFEVMTIPRSYSYVSTYSDSDTMEVLVYVSSKNSYLTRKGSVENCHIKGKNSLDEQKIDLLDIIDCDMKTKVYNHTFYLYKFCFDISFPTSTEYELSISDAIVTLDYGTKEVIIELGSFYYYKMPYYGDDCNDLVVTSLKPVLGYIGENRTISGIRIGIRNNTYTDITISDIKLLDPNVYPSLDDVKIISDETGSLEIISSILGYNYNIKSNNDVEGEISLNISSKNEIEIVVPIKYINDYPINSLGFIISYQEKGSSEIIKYYYDDYIFFNSIKESYDESYLIISTYENN